MMRPRRRTRKRTPDHVLNGLRRSFTREFNLGATPTGTLFASAAIYDKAYELECLIKIVQELKSHLPTVYPGAHITFTLCGSTTLAFRSKGGPIDRTKWGYVSVAVNYHPVAEIWIDTEFTSYSARARPRLRSRGYDRYHELDILVVEPNPHRRPRPEEILIGVECKHRKFSKALLKELLGVRREMCLHGFVSVAGSTTPANDFTWWTQVASSPPSGLILFCDNDNIRNYRGAGAFWGVHMVHHHF